MDDIKKKILGLYGKEFDPSKIRVLGNRLGGFRGYKLENEDGDWKQYWVDTDGAYGIYITIKSYKITCINIFKNTDELVLGYQGKDFYTEDKK